MQQRSIGVSEKGGERVLEKSLERETQDMHYIIM